MITHSQLAMHNHANGSNSKGTSGGAAAIAKAQAQTTRARPAAPAPVSDDPKVNILMVDDTPENLVALEAILSDLNQNLVKARSGEEALRLLLRQDFAVILLDVNMPGMNGFDTASMIRQRPNSEHTPIIFVTAISTTETHMYKGYALGAVDYIFTPVMPDVLRTKVGVFVELLKKNEEMKRQAEQLRLIEEKEHQRKLNEAAERLELQTKRNRFFTLSIDMLAIAGFDGHFKQLNPTWQATLGFTEEELKSKRFYDFVHEADREATLKQVDKAIHGDTPVSFESRYCCKDGQHRWLSWTAAPFAAEQLIYLFARDVTERKRAEQQIKQLNSDLENRAAELQATNNELQIEIATRKRTEEALQESNAALEAFSYSVSHDLRAPLRAMQGFARVLIEDYEQVLDEQGKEYAERIICAASRMDALIQDLLIYSRIGHTQLELQPINFEGVVEQVIAELEAEIKDRNAQVSLEAPLPTVKANVVTLSQVICNLITNGLKFTAPGVTPHIRICGEQSGEHGRLWVHDNGIGIQKEHHHRIFRVFERLHGADDYPGTGIGLAIVKKGIERMGGRVGLESEPGRGSSFWFELPLTSAAG